jgi:hypothetical protein
MRLDVSSSSFALIVAVAASPAAAHHSSAGYDDEAETMLDGVVTRFEWANPHVYIYLHVAAGDHAGDWEIEAGPLALMRRLGWSRETLASGERAVITVRPAQSGQPRGLYRTLRTADGSTFGEEDLVAAITDRGAPVPHEGLAGTWATLLGDTAMRLFGDDSSLKDESLWPLTAKGAAAVASFREQAESPSIDCIPYTAPFSMLIPDFKSIEVDARVVRIRGEFDASERTIHLDVDSHEAAAPTIQGHSIGRWEGNTLVVDTSVFAAHRSGLSWSVPSGAEKHLVERFEPNAHGGTLTYTFELQDPEHLTRPVTGTAEWAYRPEQRYAPEPCDRTNARRFVGE